MLLSKSKMDALKEDFKKQVRILFPMKTIIKAGQLMTVALILSCRDRGGKHSLQHALVTSPSAMFAFSVLLMTTKESMRASAPFSLRPL